jgi:iron complex outermembrane receptor protein
MYRKRLIALACLSSSATLFGSPLLHAQNRGLALEEVIVTAQKRAESIQEVPISITAFGSEKLEAMGISDIEDIGANVPNLVLNTFNNDANTVRLFIRGIGQNDVQLTQDPSVALYIDGVYVGTSIGSGIETVDLERIEVLRGPQGTLYGRNSTGGAVNLISKRPNLEEWEFKQQLTAGNFSAFNSRTTLNVPLSAVTGGEDIAAAKITYLYSERDGFVENEGSGLDWGTEDRSAYRVDLRVQPTDAITIDYAYDYSDIEDTSRFEQIRVGDDSSPLIDYFTQPASDERLDEALPARDQGDAKLEVFGHNLTLAWDVSDTLTIKSITGYRDVDSRVYHDGTPTVAAAFGGRSINLNENWVEFDQFSQEIQFVGVALDERLEYVTGLYYYDDDSKQKSEGEAVFPRLQDETTSSNESLAIFTQLTYTPQVLEDRLHITLGARYAEDDREAFRINENAPAFAEVGGSEVVGADYDESFENFNPSITVAYDLKNDMNLYAKWVTGYKSGGTSQRSANPENFSEGFDQEDVDSYEIGLKGTLFDSRISFSAAVFSNDIDGFQTSVQTGVTPGDRDFTPIDGVSVDGFEFDITALLTEGLEMSLGYGYLDTDMGVDSVSVLNSNNVIQVVAIEKQVAYAPDNSATVALDYSKPLSIGEFRVHMGYAYQDGAVTSTNAADNLDTDNRGLLDANIALTNIELANGYLNVSLWGKNLADEEYLIVSTAALANSGFSIYDWSTYGDPRTYGLTVSYEY